MTKWKNKSKEGWTRVVDGRRENMTDMEMLKSVGRKKFDKMVADDATEKAGPLEIPVSEETALGIEMSRADIQKKAKSLGIPANQTSKVLMGLIEEAEGIKEPELEEVE